MGRDKAHVEVGGIPSAARIAALLGSLFSDVLLVAGHPPPGLVGRRVRDPEGPRSALRGLVGALDAARSERVLVVATDLPLVTPDLLLALIAWPEADAVVPRDDGGAHPLCALYRRKAVQTLATERLAAGECALRGLLDGLDTSFLEGEDLRAVDPEGHALVNVNSPADLARAEKLCSGPAS